VNCACGEWQPGVSFPRGPCLSLPSPVSLSSRRVSALLCSALLCCRAGVLCESSPLAGAPPRERRVERGRGGEGGDSTLRALSRWRRTDLRRPTAHGPRTAQSAREAGGTREGFEGDRGDPSKAARTPRPPESSAGAPGRANSHFGELQEIAKAGSKVFINSTIIERCFNEFPRVLLSIHPWNVRYRCVQFLTKVKTSRTVLLGAVVHAAQHRSSCVVSVRL
jgi:hypothetical protein